MKRVAIVGMGPDTGHLAPFDDPGVEIWGLNQGYTLPYMTRYNRWFEMHERWAWEEHPGRDTDYTAWLRACTVPVYTIDVEADIPRSVRYPIERVSAAYGSYFTSTFAYMLGLAMIENYMEIGIYGIQMSLDGEYAYQRPSTEYLIGYAKGLGIQIVLPPGSPLLQAPLYGRDHVGTAALLGGYHPEIMKALFAPEVVVAKGRYLASQGATNGLPA